LYHHLQLQLPIWPSIHCLLQASRLSLMHLVSTKFTMKCLLTFQMKTLLQTIDVMLPISTYITISPLLSCLLHLCSNRSTMVCSKMSPPTFLLGGFTMAETSLSLDSNSSLLKSYYHQTSSWKI